MSRRLTDNKQITQIISEVTGFKDRNYGLSIIRLIYGLAATLALILLSIQASIGVMQASIDKYLVDNLAIAIITISGILIALTIFLICFTAKLKKIITISEFQNMLFAGAIRNKCDYCIILTEKCEIIYMDESAQKLFNASSRENYKKFSLDKIFGDDDKETRNSFFDAIRNKSEFTLLHKIGHFKFLASLNPLKYPKGFMILTAQYTN